MESSFLLNGNIVLVWARMQTSLQEYQIQISERLPSSRFSSVYLSDCGNTIRNRLPTAEARVRAQVRSYGIRGEQIGTGAVFLRELQFPLRILIPPTAPNASSIIRGW
jgi:hypothetical protein